MLTYETCYAPGFIDKLNVLCPSNVGINPKTQIKHAVDVTDLCAKLNFNILVTDEIAEDKVRIQGRTLLTNEQVSSTRLCWYMAHAIGQQLYNYRHRCPEQLQTTEQFVFANTFAEQLLAPLALIRQEIDNTRDQYQLTQNRLSEDEYEQVLLTTAKHMQISSGLLKHRLIETGLVTQVTELNL